MLGAALACASTAQSARAISPQDVRFWMGIARCETGAGGEPKWDWGSKHRAGEGSVYEGGLGFSTTVWRLWAGELGLITLYPHAYEAPPLVQIRVADYGWRAHNGYWGCMH